MNNCRRWAKVIEACTIGIFPIYVHGHHPISINRPFHSAFPNSQQPDTFTLAKKHRLQILSFWLGYLRVGCFQSFFLVDKSLCRECHGQKSFKNLLKWEPVARLPHYIYKKTLPMTLCLYPRFFVVVKLDNLPFLVPPDMWKNQNKKTRIIRSFDCYPLSLLAKASRNFHAPFRMWLELSLAAPVHSVQHSWIFIHHNLTLMPTFTATRPFRVW